MIAPIARGHLILRAVGISLWAIRFAASLSPVALLFARTTSSLHGTCRLALSTNQTSHTADSAKTWVTPRSAID